MKYKKCKCQLRVNAENAIAYNMLRISILNKINDWTNKLYLHVKNFVENNMLGNNIQNEIYGSTNKLYFQITS